MLASILASGLAAGAIYALVGVTYNTMFSTSRVMSFTAGQLAMLGGVFGSMFTLKLGMPILVGFLLTLLGMRHHRDHHRIRRGAAGAEKPRPASLRALDAGGGADDPAGRGDQMGHRAAAVPAPVRASAAGSGTKNSGCRSSPARSRFSALEYLYRRTLVGRAFLAIAEDNFAARALGLPERNLRVASYALAGVIGGVAGFSGGELLLAFFANGALLNFYGFVPVALGGLGNNRGAIVGGLALGLFQQAANFLVGGIFSSVAVFTLFIVVLLAAPQGLFGTLHGAEGVMTSVTATPAHARRRRDPRGVAARSRRSSAFSRWRSILPFVSNDYWALIGTRAAIYWVLVSGLNLVVGFAGHLAIGYVALLTLGAYTTSVLVAGNVMPPVPVFAALPIAGCRRRGVRRDRRPAGVAVAHLLFRDVDAGLRHHRDADRAGLAERHRRRHRHRQVRNFRRPSIRRGAFTRSASRLRPSPPG